MSEFRTTLYAKNEAEAYQLADEACARFYGDKPYAFDVSGTERRTFGGTVLGYEIDVTATDDVRTDSLTPIEVESTYGSAPRISEGS